MEAIKQQEQIQHILEGIAPRLGAKGAEVTLEEKEGFWKGTYRFLYEGGLFLPGFFLLPRRSYDGAYPVVLYMEVWEDPSHPVPSWITIEDVVETPERRSFLVRIAHLAGREEEVLEALKRLFLHLLGALGSLPEEA